MKKNLTLLFLLISGLSFSQIPKVVFYEESGEEYKSTEFTVSKIPAAQSAGVYHLGDSESEWDFIVIPYKSSIIIQVSSNKWGKDRTTGQDTWLKEYQTFNHVTVQGSTFKFGKYAGMFATYKGKTTNAILLKGDPTSGVIYRRDTAQIGHLNMKLSEYFESRKFPEISLKMIDEKYLAGKTKEELRYMRNEVFAMYGLIFQTKQTAAAFRKRYRPWRKDVSSSLTAIETYNLTQIKAYEKKISS